VVTSPIPQEHKKPSDLLQVIFAASFNTARADLHRNQEHLPVRTVRKSVTA
jgi:hypothetical protein